MTKRTDIHFQGQTCTRAPHALRRQIVHRLPATALLLRPARAPPAAFRVRAGANISTLSQLHFCTRFQVCRRNFQRRGGVGQESHIGAGAHLPAAAAAAAAQSHRHFSIFRSIFVAFRRVLDVHHVEHRDGHHAGEQHCLAAQPHPGDARWHGARPNSSVRVPQRKVGYSDQSRHFTRRHYLHLAQAQLSGQCRRPQQRRRRHHPVRLPAAEGQRRHQRSLTYRGECPANERGRDCL